MSAENPQLESQMQRLGPYVHPDHWDGHTFGQGATGQKLWGLAFSPGIRHYAEDTLASYLNEPAGRFALETYREKDVFNPDNYANGTIIAYRRQFLTNSFVEEDINLEGVKAAPILTALPSDKNFPKQKKIEVKLEDGGSITYMESIFWGVVARKKASASASIVQVGADSIHGAAPEIHGAAPEVYIKERLPWAVLIIPGIFDLCYF